MHFPKISLSLPLNVLQIRGMGLSLFGFLLPVVLMLQLLVSSAPREFLKNLAGESMADALVSYMVCIVWFINYLHPWISFLPFISTEEVIIACKGQFFIVYSSIHQWIIYNVLSTFGWIYIFKDTTMCRYLFIAKYTKGRIGHQRYGCLGS